MMDKVAMLKEAEVAGVLSAFVDHGYMEKMASDEFSGLVEKVAESLNDSYTVEDIASVTEAVLGGSMDKTAEEQFIDEIAPSMGYLYMAKLAEEIDGDECDAIADEYLSELLG